MKLINPYPNFTSEQIKFLSDNIDTYSTNHGHSNQIVLFGVQLCEGCSIGEHTCLDKNTVNAIENICEHVNFLSLQLDALRLSNHFYPEKAIESDTYISSVRETILEVMQGITKSDKRIWPRDIIDKINNLIGDDFISNLFPYEDWNNCLYGYIGGFEMANGKKIDGDLSIEKYVDCEKNTDAISKALEIIKYVYDLYISKLSNTTNISEFQKGFKTQHN